MTTLAGPTTTEPADATGSRRGRLAGRLAGLVAWLLAPARRRWTVPLVLYAFSRVVDGVLISALGGDQVDQQYGDGHFVAEPVEASPGYLELLTNWDGQWYEQIAEHGYPTQLPRVDGVVDQNPWAFYPLFPGLVRALMTLTHLPFTVAATVVATLAGAAAMVLLYRMVEQTGGPFAATTTVLALCMFPAAPVLQAAYTESLALLLLLASLWALRERRYGILIVAALLLSVTRPVVLPLALVVALHGVLRWRARGARPFPRRERWACLGAVVATGASFAVWPALTGLATGEADAYFATQQAWVLEDGASGWPSWVVTLTDPGHRTAGVVALVALAALLLVVCRPAARVWGWELRTWSVVYAVYLVVATRPTTSAVRYAMLAVVPWWPAPQPRDHQLSRRQQVLVLTSVVVLGLALQVFWVNRFYVMHQGVLGYP